MMTFAIVSLLSLLSMQPAFLLSLLFIARLGVRVTAVPPCPICNLRLTLHGVLLAITLTFYLSKSITDNHSTVRTPVMQTLLSVTVPPTWSSVALLAMRAARFITRPLYAMRPVRLLTCISTLPTCTPARNLGPLCWQTSSPVCSSSVNTSWHICMLTKHTWHCLNI